MNFDRLAIVTVMLALAIGRLAISGAEHLEDPDEYPFPMIHQYDGEYNNLRYGSD